MKKIILLILLLIPLAQAATISGNIYDINLNTAENTILKINTIPEQILVSKDGSYTFTINPGNYIITAKYKEHTITKEIKIVEEGKYVLDLILSDIQQVEPIEPEESTNIIWYIIIAVIIITLLIFFYKKKKKIKPKQDDELTNKVLNYIKEQGNRTTQKEIRKKFPMSEAKISLVITELEHKNIIKKIKKGRGNIIIRN